MFHEHETITTRVRVDVTETVEVESRRVRGRRTYRVRALWRGKPTSYVRASGDASRMRAIVGALQRAMKRDVAARAASGRDHEQTIESGRRAGVRVEFESDGTATITCVTCGLTWHRTFAKRRGERWRACEAGCNRGRLHEG